MVDPVTTKPTPLAERTLVGALAALCMLAMVFASFLLLPRWPDAVAPDRICYLGCALILAVLGILIMVIAFASPWLGSVQVRGMGVDLDIKGDQANG